MILTGLNTRKNLLSNILHILVAMTRNNSFWIQTSSMFVYTLIRRQAIILTDVRTLSIGTLWTNFCRLQNGGHFCPEGNELNMTVLFCSESHRSHLFWAWDIECETMSKEVTRTNPGVNTRAFYSGIYHCQVSMDTIKVTYGRHDIISGSVPNMP